MRTNGITSAAGQLLAALLLFGCRGLPAPAPPPPRPVVVEAIALCSGGGFASSSTELEAMWLKNRGALIGASEVVFGSVSPFQFGDLNGEQVVAMYNRYVQCINTQTSALTPRDSVQSEGVEVTSCHISPRRAIQDDPSRFYRCVVKNTAVARRSCVLVVSCVDRDEVLGFASRQVLIAAGDVGSESGFVDCGGRGARQIDPVLACGTN